MHRPSGKGIKFDIAANLVRHHLELRVYDNYMRLDFGASQPAPTKSMEGSLEQVEADVLDDHCTRTRLGLGS